MRKNAILEPTWRQLGPPKQKRMQARRDTRRPLRGASLHHKGMGCPDASRSTRWWVYETPAHCDASRISAGVHFRESALARRNHAKHFQNLPTMCSKGPKSSKISPQPLPKPLQNPPKATPNPSRSPFGAHFVGRKHLSSQNVVFLSSGRRPKAPKGGPRRPRTPPKYSPRPSQN